MAPEVTEILLLRHGHRMAWTVDPATGEYKSTHPFPTGLPADPPLVAHGATQAQELADWLVRDSSDSGGRGGGGGGLAALARRGRLRIYSSPWYRCLETLRPTVRRLAEAGAEGGGAAVTVRADRGVGEWFGKAWFAQPTPASPERLRREFFPFVEDATPERPAAALPHPRGERIAELHDRVARALDFIVQEVEREHRPRGASRDEEEGEGGITLLICGHAAQIVAAGRALTGLMPQDPDVEDFRCYTAGISKFVRRQRPAESQDGNGEDIDWRGKGVAGGWDCVLNSWCGHLSGGEERGWHFHGDESFDSYAPLEETATPKDGSVGIGGRDGGREPDRGSKSTAEGKAVL